MSNDDVITIEGVDRTFSRRKIMIVLLIPLAMVLMSVSSVNVALPAIQSSIGATPSDIQWLLSGYSLSFGIFLVAAGRIGDVIGRGVTYIAGVAIFSVCSLLCGLVDDPMWLNTLRLLQGVGAGAYAPQTNGMIVQYFRGQARATANALFGLTVSVAVAVAPLITGLLIQILDPDWGWRASFIWNFPLGLAAIGLALAWLPFENERIIIANRKAGIKRTEKLDLDPLGMIILALCVLCVMLPFMIKTLVSFTLLVIGVALMVIWVRWENYYLKRGREPMVNLNLFKTRSFTNATAISTVQFLGGTSIFVLLALFLQQGLGASAIVAGSIGLPNAIASALAAMVAGRSVLRKGRTMTMHALAIYMAGIATTIILIQFMPTISYWWLALSLILCGLGVGAFNSANQTLSMLELTPAVGGTAGGVKQTCERTATAIGNAMLTAIVFSFVASGWILAVTIGYGVILVILFLAFLLAWYDKRALGDPEPLR